MRTHQASSGIQSIRRCVCPDRGMAVPLMVQGLRECALTNLWHAEPFQAQRTVEGVAGSEPRSGASERPPCAAEAKVWADGSGPRRYEERGREQMRALRSRSEIGNRPRPQHGPRARAALWTVQHVAGMARTRRSSGQGRFVLGLKLDQPCHADVLLEWANAPGGAE